MTCSRRVVLGCLLSGALLRPARADTERRSIAVQPLGPVPKAELEAVTRALRAFYDFPLRVLGPTPLPKDAYYPPRKRYRAEKLLRVLETRLPADSVRILGVTASDISTTKPPHADWGILGLATIGGPAAVISSFRARRGATDDAHAGTRLSKTTVHELGHGFGLEHCPRRGCLMADGQGTVATTDQNEDLCPDCRSSLKRRGVALTGSSVPAPWRSSG